MQRLPLHLARGARFPMHNELTRGCRMACSGRLSIHVFNIGRFCTGAFPVSFQSTGWRWRAMGKEGSHDNIPRTIARLLASGLILNATIPLEVLAQGMPTPVAQAAEAAAFSIEQL